ncbi:MAG TPA: Maf family protein [Bryobacteraceae bacterium]|nr:Maf family protein [Bryobacteraceae bacterium]
MNLILASASPRRSELLASAGIRFTVRVSQVEERHVPGEDAWQYVKRLAEAKARTIESTPGEVVLGADTVVVVDDHILEKPADHADAARMLRLLSGRRHQVITGICLRGLNRITVDAETTEVRFVSLSEAEIDDYVRTGEPMDKAGGYAIQGLASKFIDRVEGCYFNVVGLPVALVYQKLKEFEGMHE